MSLRSLLSVALVSLLLTACQTTGGTPSASTVSILQREGFKPDDMKSFNEGLTKGDLVTTAIYSCEEPQCRHFSILAFANDPDDKPITAKDVAEFNALSTRGKSRFWSKLNDGVSDGTFRNIQGRIVTVEGGYALRLTADFSEKSLRSSGIPNGKLYAGFVYVSRGSVNRGLVIVSTSKAAASRWTTPSLLD